MLGRDHALSGALVLAALAPVLHLPVDILPAAVVLGAGAGVLPDIDHPDSTISRSFGFMTEAFSWLVHKLSGGHRHGTHSIVGIAVFTTGAYAAGALQAAHAAHGLIIDHKTFTWDMVPALLYMSLLYSSALRALHIGGHHGDLIGIASALATIATAADVATFHIWHWSVPLLALCTGLGCAAHIAGDELTHGGCPVLWPVSKHEFHLLPRPLQITTAKLCETWVVFPILVVALAAAVWHATGHPLQFSQTKY